METPIKIENLMDISKEPTSFTSNLRLQLEDLAFGSVAGMVGKVIEYPFDTVKVRLQTQSVTNPVFKGPLDCFKATIKNEGVMGLFRGISSPIIGAMLENAVLFVGYRQIQRQIREFSPPIETSTTTLDEHGQVPLTFNQLTLAGALSGSLISIVLTPVELVKCKIQVQNILKNTKAQQFNQPSDVIKQICRAQGFAGLYRGFIPTFIRETGGNAFWFGVYEYTCAALIQYRRNRAIETEKIITKNDLTAPELMIAGAVGGIAYNLSFFPVDVIKSRLQIQQGNAQSQFKSSIQIAKEIYAGTGFKGFYRGCGITAAKSAPANAIIFMTYELLSRHLGSS
ncbi:MAG: mitochondrial carrier domain-containing protein [Benjaminiella poitrasii]|nr:MAG: mitochondrial carrier domain-containing protein [Benjaminiella poitrasii]